LPTKRYYFIAVLTIAQLAFPLPGYAKQTVLVPGSNGAPFMQVEIFGERDGPFWGRTEGTPEPSFRTLSATEAGQTLSAIRYWAEVIRTSPGHTPATVHVGGILDENAFAFSPLVGPLPAAGTKVQAALNGGAPGWQRSDADAMIGIGLLGTASSPFAPSQIPLSAQADLPSIVIHEVGHALGIGAGEIVTGPGNSGNDVYARLPAVLDAWSSHLYDDNGQQARAGAALRCVICTEVSGEPVFDLSNDQGTFRGAEVSQVLAGGLDGIPVRMLTDGHPDQPFLAHFELKNSMMSHQSYRNYATLMEAEFAALQDLGYSIDRRNFFGFSVYGDGQTLVSDHPFLARNAQGTGYIDNEPNTATMGLGLHIYGSHNTVTQKADLLSMGAGGAGIRVDGAGNTVTVAPGSRILAGGALGRGVMFTYGKDHDLVQRGSVEAPGQGGIGVSFDFGNNLLGNADEYRGSYIHTESGMDAELPDELNGPLVRTFDLTGRLMGQRAAIYMSPNGYVDTINVMRGASVSGDIVSDYITQDETGAGRLTKLTFGQAADNNGRTTGKPDPDFTLTYGGNIRGINSLSLLFAGGKTDLSGSHTIHDVTIASGAVLRGNASYTLNHAGTFINHGVVAPVLDGSSSRLTITGDYQQGSDGTLAVQFNDRGAVSGLAISGEAAVAGQLTLTPQPGFYDNGFHVSQSRALEAARISGAFDKVTVISTSPTLAAGITTTAAGDSVVSLTRSDDSYARYADNENGRQAGTVLAGAAGDAGSGLNKLLAALDFSNPDGSVVGKALSQLTASPYATVASILVSDSAILRRAVNNRLLEASDHKPGDPAAAGAELRGIQAWQAGFGGWNRLAADEAGGTARSSVSGFATGFDRTVSDAGRLGLMAAYSVSAFRIDGLNTSGSSENYTLGGYGGWEWEYPQGSIGLRGGLAYTWHQLSVSRSVAVPDFADSLSADYRAGTFQLFGELGYKMPVAPRSVIEPYAGFAFVHFAGDGFTETGPGGTALNVGSTRLSTGLSTLGIRAATQFDLGTVVTTARVDLGWMHTYGDGRARASARFDAGSDLFTAAGKQTGRNTGLFEAGLDFQLTPSAVLGVSYSGQYSSSGKQNGVNANLSIKF